LDFSSFAVLPRDRFWPAAVGCVFGFAVFTTILIPNATAAETSKANGKTKTGVVPMSGQDEECWRGKAGGLLDRIAATEQRIEAKKDAIKKLGNGGFDITTGMKNNIAYIQDRNAQLQELEKHKTDVQKQLDELQDAGRKVGAPSSWFR